jgi:hypothetical protein
MRRYLLVALWPTGLAVIAAATVIAIRREPASPAMDADEPPDSALAKPSAPAEVRRGGTPRSHFIPCGISGHVEQAGARLDRQGGAG